MDHAKASQLVESATIAELKERRPNMGFEPDFSVADDYSFDTKPKFNAFAQGILDRVSEAAGKTIKVADDYPSPSLLKADLKGLMYDLITRTVKAFKL